MANVSSVKNQGQVQQPQGLVARCASRCGLASQKSSIAPAQQPVVVKSSGLSACVSNVFAAIRKCLSCVPLVGRLFVEKPAPVVAAPVAPKPSLSATVTNAALSALAKSKAFVVNHKALTAGTAVGVVGLGAAVYFRAPVMAKLDETVQTVRGLFNNATKTGE